MRNKLKVLQIVLCWKTLNFSRYQSLTWTTCDNSENTADEYRGERAALLRWLCREGSELRLPHCSPYLQSFQERNRREQRNAMKENRETWTILILFSCNGLCERRREPQPAIKNRNKLNSEWENRIHTYEKTLANCVLLLKWMNNQPDHSDIMFVLESLKSTKINVFWTLQFFNREWRVMRFANNWI